jgi:hypothetical protein
MNITLEELMNASLRELEEIYLNEPVRDKPSGGEYRGTVLKRLNNPGANNRFNILSQWALFDLSPFGINFYHGRGNWYFVHPKLTTGEFRWRRQTSRWRDTETIGLHYDGSQLPNVIRNLLYDEVKPLSGSLMLGIGGTNADVNQGDHFFFALCRT